MYQDKLAQLKRQVQQLKDGTLPVYMKKMKKLDQQCKERLRLNSLWVKRELELVQEEYKSEKELANKEFEVQRRMFTLHSCIFSDSDQNESSQASEAILV